MNTCKMVIEYALKMLAAGEMYDLKITLTNLSKLINGLSEWDARDAIEAILKEVEEDA